MYRVTATAALLTQLFTKGNEVQSFGCVDGLPEGSTLEVVRYNHERGVVEFYFSHPATSPKDVYECQVTMNRKE